MKVTAIIEDNLINDALKYSHQSTITDALKVALKNFVRQEKLKKLQDRINNAPFEFYQTAEELRNLNRKI